MSRPTKRRLDFRGLPVNIELEAGDKKDGVDALGRPWSVVYKFPYGEVAGTDGADGDPVDCYIGPNQDAPNIYVVHQLTQDLDGSSRLFDEEKVFLGFDTMDQVVEAYFSHGPYWGFGGCTILTFDHFKNDWLKRGPLRAYDPVMFAGGL